MSIEAMHWALRVPLGGNAKVVLIGVANHAHPDGTEAYPTLDTLAGYAHIDRSTARRQVRKLLDDGWLIEDGTGPRGQMKYRLPLGWQNATPEPTRGVASEPEGGGIAMPPEPSIEPSSSSSSAPAREAVDRKAISTDQRRVLDELLRVAAARGVALDEQAALRVLLDFPDRAHVHEAVGFADYWTTGTGRNNTLSAVVKAWRNWLRRSKPAPPEQRERAAKPQTWEAAREVVAKAARERRYATTPEFAAEFLRSEGHEAAARWVERVGLGVAAQQASANDPVDFEAANG